MLFRSERAFERGELVAFTLPRFQVRADLFQAPEVAEPAPDAPTDWVEIVAEDKDGEPYVGAYSLELPDGRVISGQLSAGGRVRFDGINPGACKVTFS